MNERITEEITRKLLKKNGYTKENGFIVEEQKSKSRRMNTLLEGASKSGDGRGYPEFIIRNDEDKETIVVIECKADIKKHRSGCEDFSNTNEYAVDGVVHYGRFLAERFNVIAIAISGQNEKELLVDTFFITKNTKRIIEIDNHNKLLPFDILNGKGPIKRQSIKEKEKLLMKFASQLHEDMRDYAKLSEEQKPILVSAILMALRSEAFRVSYKKYKRADKLSKRLVQTVVDGFEDAELPSNKIKNLKQSFSFIEVHPELNRGEVLLELIEKIDENVYDFLHDDLRHIDIIGKFYGEFLKYTGGDGKGLGIVLTPRHITEFFCDIAQINKDSIVVDTCQGTGGFLISAMDRMIEDAKNDEEKIKEIKAEQLIGCEQQPHMYTLGTSNMVLRGDGKANIYMGSCFDLKDSLKKHKPNVGFINPPYSQKGEGLSELDFIENILDIVETNGTVVAIVPISVALNTRSPIKKRLLKKHTLEAVFSMPDDLFYPVGTVTCVMVFKVGVAHPEDYETFFGYYKDDGFVKTRTEGRVDLYGKFEEEIKDKWVNTYINKKEIPGFSVKKSVSYDDEWVAEAYMETDYSTLKDEDFEKEIRKYMAYLLENDLVEDANEESEEGEEDA